jgi:hypothetical protein
MIIGRALTDTKTNIQKDCQSQCDFDNDFGERSNELLISLYLFERYDSRVKQTYSKPQRGDDESDSTDDK